MIKMRTLFRFYMLLLFLGSSLGITAQTKIYYVSPTGGGDGTSWEATTTLQTALQNAVAGDQIWVQGFEQVTSADQLYIAPADGFSVKSGVQLYGGFKGDETNVNSRETLGKPYQMKYRSVLSGDIGKNDVVDNTNLIFPANTTRSDNATHVLDVDMAPASGSNKNTSPTIINGFSIGNGHADGSGEKGGGIYIHGDNTDGGIFRIERCFLLNNYATQGGAIYVAAEVKNVNNSTSLVNQCVVYNNAAGERAAVENAGGGIYLAGEATVVNSSIFNNENGGLRLADGAEIVNCTVARNTSGGIDMIDNNATGYNVANTIIWGNSTLSTQYRPKFKNSAFHEVESDDSDGNIYLTAENNGSADAPMFDAPSVKTSYDRDFNWRQTAYPLWSWNVIEGSTVIDKGDNDFYQATYGSEDMAGNQRQDGDVIDIGAYEYQHLAKSRIRYVKQTASGSGDGTSWDNASNDLQKMIDELADNNPQNLAGEVWVASGTYEPQSQLISGTAYSASFRMRDGISVYGGFAGTESSKQERKMKTDGMPWDFSNETILQAAYYEHANLQWNNNKWTLTSDSRHVVWFAPMSGEAEFTRVTTLDGVSIQGGYAQGGTGFDEFKTDRGAGVYMDGVNTYMANCIVRENYATGNGGGVYLKDGRVQTSLIYNNNSDADGGAVYVDNTGLVHRSMLTNNSAHNGAGVYLCNEVESNDNPEYLILSTCVVSNNTMTGNGAIYCDKGGVLMQNTITNNSCVTATDATDSNASQTGGIYIDEYALVINSVIWNNRKGTINIPMYARNPSTSTVRFLYNAISGTNNAVWNYTLQEQTLSLVDENAGATDDGSSIGPRFTEPVDLGITDFDLEDNYGVQDAWKDDIISYYWKPVSGSNLWARGMALGLLPDEVVLAPELDIQGNTFAQKPAVGAFMVEATEIEHAETDDALIVYVDIECTEPDHTGNTWATAYRSLNNAISHLANLESDIVGSKRLEVHVLEGDLWPRYAFTNNDPKTATVTVPVTLSGQAIEIYGGYHRDATDPTNNTVVRDPLTYRSVINGNTEAKSIEEGLYHCITVEQGAKLVLDGFHVINGYAAGEASRQYGAGLLAHAGSTVTVRNCIFENNTAQEGAAIDAREATLTLRNCVVNNNTNITETASVINAQTLTMEHVTVVNNVGAAPATMGTSSFSAGNTSGTDSQSLASIGETGAANFANPTNAAGATLGFDTYLGGYAEFRPLTSSTEAANLINKATGTSADNTKDITTINSRNLGGAPDLGAYEAILPESGVIYVRSADGSDNNDGSSWGTAFATLTKALSVAKSGDKIWVAAGTYTGTITGNPDNVNATTNIYSQPYAYKMVEGVNVYGGFPASGTPGEDDRDPNLYETILQAKDSPTEFPTVEGDGPTTVGRVVVQPEHFNTETVWDGFTIKNGYLNTHFRYAISGNFLNVQTGLYYNDNEKGIGHVAGAGAFLMGNGVLENCRIEYNHILAWDKNQINSGGGTHGAGAGVYSIGGVLRNCQVLDNVLKVYSNQDPYTSSDKVGSAFAYGAGIYMLNDGNYKAAVYNSVVADNTLEARVWQGAGAADGGTAIYHTIAIGAGICQVSGDFYNNTIVGNKAYTDNAPRANIICGGLMLYEGAKIYNCIIYNNTGETKRPNNNDDRFGLAQYMNEQLVCLKIKDAGFSGWINPGDGSTGAADDLGNNGYNIEKASIDIQYSNVGRLDENDQPEKSTFLEYTDGDNEVTYESRHNTYLYPEFVGESAGNYRLDTGSPAINSGTEAIPDDNGGYIVIPDYDAEYTDRIKDCGIDMGAFESENEGNIGYETVTEEDGTKKYIYYVTQNGDGLRSGNSVANAACAMKLQQILTAAGTAATTLTDGQVYVRVAGYENQSFVYHANTLSSANDPQSYTYVVPEGIIVEGGYDEDFTERSPMKYQTVLSAVSEANSSTTQTVHGYHAVTFGAWPGTAALTKAAVIDGLYLIDGSATSMAGTGDPRTRGGGAIVPSGAHVRNCVVMNCEAIEGGGLYLLPGATVSGTAVIECTATNGAGIYAANTDVDADSRAHILSCTIANNEASSTGGGIYMEDGAVMSVNTVVFDNRAGSDKNVSGVVSLQFDDNKLDDVYGITGTTSFYPFNNCFVETQEMPSDFENRMLESDKSLYFIKDDDYYRLKDYSFLIKHGVKNDYQTKLVEIFNVATQDMQNIDRIQTSNGAERLDAGAFAYEGGILPTDLFTRIFVSPTTNVTLPDGEDMNTYLGRSFYTSFSTLEDALGYIRSMRSGDSPKATDETKFEILISGGTYKPSYLRTTGAAVDQDQKLYSFVVPQGVSIYGGFAGTEMYSSKVDGGADLTEIPGMTGTFSCMGEITDILNARAYSDFNQNGIYEPWELANQTILSGNINASSTAQNAYHVVFTEKGTATTVNPVVLDGLTVMYGQTDNELSYVTNEDEQGRGGGIYSSGVTYTISRCRLLNNTAVRGGAVFVRNADLNLSGCILAGNKTVANTAQGTNTLTSRGGAAYVSSIDEEVNLRAVNTLWANNESADEGGAIGTNYVDGITSASAPYLYIMNNTFVRNKATTNPVIYAHNGKSHIVNTLIWGNEGNSYDGTSLSNIYDVSHSASDVDYVGKFTLENTDNILLSADNMGDKGPRFTNPSTVAGADGNSASSLWNPVAISVLTDAGDGTEHTANKNPNESDSDHKSDGTITGAYQEWFDATGYLGKNEVTEAYITGTYSRYSGPRGQNNEELCKPIDIGLYEYQYYSNFSSMTAIYVNTISQGDGSGNSWANATDDLRGAIVGAANPTQEEGERTVYVRDGNYSWDKLSAGTAYILNMSSSSDLSESLTLKGSCTGSGTQQDFSKQTILRNDGSTNDLMAVSANTKKVIIEGFTFINTTTDGTGMDASTGSGGSLTLKNCGFRISDKGLDITGNSGKMLIYNTLFADGGTGLSEADANTTVVNATFANNTTDYTTTGTTAIYNSVAWNNDTQNLTTYATTNTTNNNVSIAGTIANDNVNEGPNFRDPDNTVIESRDYRIRPSVQLLNKGSNDHYIDYVLELTADDAVIPTDEKDLGNNARLVDNAIDIGAYEYEAPLQPIVYVKPDLTGTADGKSWETALGDLQGAVDLAGLYAYNNTGQNGYVFVHGNYHNTGSINLTLGNTKVYGGMNDERSTETDTETIVSDLLGKRKGMLENTNRSSLGTVTISADGVIDGFEVTGAATVNNGTLSTSVVKNDVDGAADGLLYNSLVLGEVSGVKAVNVTATGSIAEVIGNGNNRASVTETNSYVTDDYWKYQLMETATDDIDKGTDSDTKSCIDKVGHSRDLIGNARIRNTVDNGCFETWNICEGMTTDSDNDGNVDAYPITATDYPVGKSVVYVRKGQELKIQNADDGTLVYPNGNAFNPGFLLLEHQAGLRGNGNYISLTNFAVERDVAGNGNDLAVMPFEINSMSPSSGYNLKRYSGQIRAAYSYQYDGSDGNAWTGDDFAQMETTEGFLIENTSSDNITVRFNGNLYSEGGTDKSVVLYKWNYNDPWSSSSSGGNKFTHKENMSWNLFGSPYLCAMNYGDMEYGRVIYGYTEGAYKTINTAGETAGGYIPAGDAVFTQTATLKDAEIVGIKTSEQKDGVSYAAAANLTVGLSQAGATRAAGADKADVLQLNAVPASEARNYFDIASDGVKWMAADSVAQLYAACSGARYSLLSAVSESGEVAVGVTLPEPGMYTFYIPEICDAGNYESVVLKDAKTGKQTNLLDGGYDFTSVDGGDISGRFTISFNRMLDDDKNADIRAWSPLRDRVSVSGVEAGDRIVVYSAGGVQAASRVASSSVENIQASVSGVAVVEITRDGRTIAVRKVKMK